MIQAWWLRYPGLYEWELRELKTAGFAVTAEHPPNEPHGVVQLRVTDGPGMDLGDLLVTFPDLYPWFRFEVQTTTGEWLGRHHHPFGSTLCLIGRRTENWAHDTVADFLSDRLRTLVATIADPASEDAARGEEQAGEPFSDYYSYEPGSVFLMDGEYAVGDADRGKLKLLVEATSSGGGLRGSVMSVRDAAGEWLGPAEPRLPRPGTPIISGRWVRLLGPPTTNDPIEVLNLAVEVDSSLQQSHWQNVNGLSVDVVGLVFPEETTWRTTTESWLFMVRSKGALGGR